MNRKSLLRWLAALVVLDGIALLLGGRTYARAWEALPGPRSYRRLANWFAMLPGWAMRLVGLVEVALGVAALGRARSGVEELYQRGSASYDAIATAWRWDLFPATQRAFDRAMAEYLPQGGRVLDLGCGTGANLERLLALNLPFGSYTGVDLSSAMLDRAREKLGDVKKASFRRLDLISDPLPEGPFDLVVSSWVFSHLPEPVHVVEKAMDRLVDGGHVVLLFLARSGGWSDWLVDPILASFSARGVSRDDYLAFPGRVRMERFFGGHLVAVVLRKGVRAQATGHRESDEAPKVR